MLTEKQTEYLVNQGWSSPSKIVAIPLEIVEKAKNEIGFASAVVELDPSAEEIFKECKHIALVRWLQVRGLYKMYEDYISGANDEMDLSSMQRLSKIKTESETINKDGLSPQAPIAPAPPQAPIAPAPSVQEEKHAVYLSYVQRLKLLTEKGFLLNVSVDGYVKDNNRYISANTVKNFTAPEEVIDKEWESLVESASSEEWMNPNDIAIEGIPAIEGSPDIPAIEGIPAIKGIPDITKGLSEKKTEKTPKKLSIKEEEAIQEERIESLKALNFTRDSRTYKWELEELSVTHSMLTDFSIGGKVKFQAILHEAKEVNKKAEELSKKAEEKEFSMPITEKIEALMRVGWTMHYGKNILYLPDSHLKITEKQLENKTTLEQWESFVNVSQRKAKNNAERIANATIKRDFPVKVDEIPEIETPVEEIKTDVLKIETPVEEIETDVEEIKPAEKSKILRTNFFTQLLKYNFDSVSFSIQKKEGGTYALKIKPDSKIKDDSLKNLPSLNLDGTAKDFDLFFFKEIDTPLAETAMLFKQSDHYLKTLNDAKEKAAVGQQITKLLNAAVKYSEGEKITPATLKKRWQAVLDLDPKNTRALLEINKLN